jgi:hypothetical protein
MSKLIAPKLCAYCHEPFTPVRPEQKFCPRPARCAQRSQGEQLRGIAPTAAIAAKKARDAAIVQARCRERFGEMSERDQAIYAFGHTTGYDKGYLAGVRPITARKSA